GGEELRQGAPLDGELDTAAAGVGERIASDLRDCRRDPRLVLAVETQQRRDLARALTGRDDVVLVLDRERQNRRHLSWGAPTWPPTPPNARTRPGRAVARLGVATRRLIAPPPPSRRRAARPPGGPPDRPPNPPPPPTPPTATPATPPAPHTTPTSPPLPPPPPLPHLPTAAPPVPPRSSPPNFSSAEGSAPLPLTPPPRGRPPPGTPSPRQPSRLQSIPWRASGSPHTVSSRHHHRHVV